jgi:hypothetical protein
VHPTQTSPSEGSLARANITGSARREKRGLRLLLDILKNFSTHQVESRNPAMIGKTPEKGENFYQVKKTQV